VKWLFLASKQAIANKKCFFFTLFDFDKKISVFEQQEMKNSDGKTIAYILRKPEHLRTKSNDSAHIEIEKKLRLTEHASK